MILRTIDPGLRGCGAAEFYIALEGGRAFPQLLRAAYVRNLKDGRCYPAHAGMAEAVVDWYGTRKVAWNKVEDLLIIEHPRAYPGMPKTDPNDLLDVCGVGAACAAVLQNYTRLESVFPFEWKGNVDKKAMTARIESKLTLHELEKIEPVGRALRHNVLDAIGIGLWKFGRLNAKVYPR